MQFSTKDQINAIYQELSKEYITNIENAMEYYKMDDWVSDRWYGLRFEMGLQSQHNIEDFKKGFPQILLTFLQDLNLKIFKDNPFVDLENLRTLPCLMQKSFFNTMDPIVKRTIINDLVHFVNEKTKAFFLERKERLDLILAARIAKKKPENKWVLKRVKKVGELMPDPDTDDDTTTQTLNTQVKNSQQAKQSSQNTQQGDLIQQVQQTQVTIHPEQSIMKKIVLKRKDDEPKSLNQSVIRSKDLNMSVQETSKETSQNHSKKQKQSQTQNQSKSSSPDFEKCVCKVTLKVVSNPSQSIRCKTCPYSFHLSCVKAVKADEDYYVCPFCTITNMDFYSPVESVIKSPKFYQLGPSQVLNLEFRITDVSRYTQIQLRCLRVDDNHGLDEMTWPDLGEIIVNSSKQFEFKPLTQNTALKKRKDAPFILLKDKINQNGGPNTVTLKETKAKTTEENNHYRIAINQTYMVGLFICQNYNPEALTKRILKDKTSMISPEQGKEIIKFQLKQMEADGVQVDKLKIQVTCFYNLQLITTPVRGSLCIHAQCFSLENYLQMNLGTTKDQGHRKLRCPICKRKCYKLIIDSYQMSLIKGLMRVGSQSHELVFDHNGDVVEDEQTGQIIQKDEPKHLNKNAMLVEDVESGEVSEKGKITEIIILD